MTNKKFTGPYRRSSEIAEIMTRDGRKISRQAIEQWDKQGKLHIHEHAIKFNVKLFPLDQCIEIWENNKDQREKRNAWRKQQ